MTDHDKATLEFGKEFFKNTECDYIEIVRRFVKYEEIRLLHKHYGQMKAAALAAAEVWIYFCWSAPLKRKRCR